MFTVNSYDVKAHSYLQIGETDYHSGTESFCSGIWNNDTFTAEWICNESISWVSGLDYLCVKTVHDCRYKTIPMYVLSGILGYACLDLQQNRMLVKKENLC